MFHPTEPQKQPKINKNVRVIEAFASVGVVVISSPVEPDQFDTDDDARDAEEETPSHAEPKPVLNKQTTGNSYHRNVQITLTRRNFVNKIFDNTK